MTYVRLTEAARLYHIHHSALYRWVEAGELDHKRFAGKLYVHREQAADLVATRRGLLAVS